MGVFASTTGMLGLRDRRESRCPQAISTTKLIQGHTLPNRSHSASEHTYKKITFGRPTNLMKMIELRKNMDILYNIAEKGTLHCNRMAPILLGYILES